MIHIKKPDIYDKIMVKNIKNNIYDFVINNKIKCYRAFKEGIKHKDYKKPEGKKLIELARKELSYSDKIWDGDIYNILWNVYKRITIDDIKKEKLDQYNMIHKEKQKDMKITVTPETKIKEIIPEGYELIDLDHHPFLFMNHSKGEYTSIGLNIKKKPEKNFEWYINEYYKFNISLPELASVYKQYGYDMLKNKDYSQPFEYRIGLFKFICDSKFPGYGYVEVISDIIKGNKTLVSFQISEFCPEGFINSLIK